MLCYHREGWICLPVSWFIKTLSVISSLNNVETFRIRCFSECITYTQHHAYASSQLFGCVPQSPRTDCQLFGCPPQSLRTVIIVKTSNRWTCCTDVCQCRSQCTHPAGQWESHRKPQTDMASALSINIPVKLIARPAPYTPIPNVTMVMWWNTAFANIPKRATIISGTAIYCACQKTITSSIKKGLLPRFCTRAFGS